MASDGITLEPASGFKRKSRKTGKASGSGSAPAPQPLPRWITKSGVARSGVTGAEAAFAAGAATLALDQIIRSDPPWLGCLRMRLALKAATIAARMLRLNADEAALRDARHLTRAGDDPGPAGRLHRLLRRFATRPDRFAEETLALISAEVGEVDSAEIRALLGADLALAQRLGWSVPLLLHITVILDSGLRQGESGKRPKVGDEAWPSFEYAVLAIAVGAAHAQAVDLQRKATALAFAADGLRTRDHGAGLAQVCGDESVAPWRMVASGQPGLGSDRAARRFCETLAGQGVLRLLTDRPTFRLYGL
jgi:Protein of unknown function (DUF1403)